MDFLVTNQAMKARYALPTIASDSVKFTSLTFYFDSSWDGLVKTAYFHQTDLDSPIASLLDSSGTCYLPNGLTAGKAYVGLSGHSSDGETIATTNKVLLVISQSAFDDDAQAEVEPSPSLYAELLAQFEEYVGQAEGYASNAETSATSASGSATSANSSATSASTSASNAASSATSAETSATNASTSATNASTSATNADTSATNAETSRQAIEDMEVEVSTGAAYSVATVTKTTEDGVVTLTFVIPKGDTGAPFYIAKTYSSVLEMNADYDGTDVEVNEFVLISTSSVEDEDNAKVYVKTDTSYQFVTDLSGAQGIQGQTGNGIASITLTSTVGLVKTYTILFTDSTTTTFSVTDGEKGDAFTTEMTYSSVSAMNAGYATDGVSIGGYVIISPASTSDPDYGKVYQKGSTEYEYVITMAGVDGNGIASVTKTSTSGLVDTYTISYTDGTSTTYTVTNGADGVDGANGTNGIDGSSAYEVAVENGYSGTEAQWLASLQATATVVNDTLTSASTTQALSANQGKALSESLSQKADLSTHNIQTYTSLEQLDMTEENTIEEVIMAMPDRSMLLIQSWATSDHPTQIDAGQGVLQIEKRAAQRVSIMMFKSFANSIAPTSVLGAWAHGQTPRLYWQKIAVAISPIPVLLSPATTFVSNGLCECSLSQEGIVTVNFCATCSVDSNMWTRVATLPSGYRPSDKVCGTVSAPQSETVHSTCCGAFYVSSDGTVAIKFEDTISNQQIGLIATFIV